MRKRERGWGTDKGGEVNEKDTEGKERMGGRRGGGEGRIILCLAVDGGKRGEERRGEVGRGKEKRLGEKNIEGNILHRLFSTKGGREGRGKAGRVEGKGKGGGRERRKGKKRVVGKRK